MSATEERRLPTSFRADAEQLKAIQAQADEYGLSRTEYMLRASLGTLPEQQSNLDQQLDAIRQRLQRLEDLAYSG